MRLSIEMFGWMLVGLVTVVMAFEGVNLDEEMAYEEYKKILDEGPGAGHDYDVVPISVPKHHKRSDGSPTPIRLQAFRRSVDLLLTPSEGSLIGKNTPVYLAKSDRTSKLGSRISLISNAGDEMGQIMEDRQKKASLLVKKLPDGRTVIAGNIGAEGWTVRPVSNLVNTRLSNRYPNGRYQRSVNDVDDDKNVTGDHSTITYHVITKTPALSEDEIYGALRIPEDVADDLPSRSRRDVPSTVYPQIFVIVNHAIYDLHERYIYGLLEYLLPFWNGVDLRYRSLENPKVRLNIAGILVASDADALPFISSNVNSEGTLNASAALLSLGQYMRTMEPFFSLDTYDIAVAMTPYEMCASRNNNCQPGTLGLAYIEGACNFDKDKRAKDSYSVALVQDKGGYHGVHTAAHELGHLFGAQHDGKLTACSLEAGHIMAPTPALTDNSSDWSQCTLNSFNKYFQSKRARCLDNYPNAGPALARVLPGRILTADEQCEKIEGTKACYIDERICKSLACVMKESSRSCITTGVGAADGTSCGVDKICFKGKCLLETNIN